MTKNTQHSHLRHAILAAAVLALVSIALPAMALRVVDWNILNYPGNSGPSRAPYYRTILSPLGADVIVTEEMSSPGGTNEFLNEVLDVMEPGQWAAAPFIDGNDTDASMFYKPAKVQYLGEWAFYPNPSYQLRFVHVYRLKPVGYSAASTELRIYTAHLKASQGYESDRLAECAGIRDSLNVLPAGVHGLLCGDLNFYSAGSEPGYTRLIESESNNTGRLFDLLPAGTWHDGSQFVHIHTQSTCLSSNCAPGAATGGLDDRFDFTLPTYNLVTGQGLAVIPGTDISVGNDGLHFNKAITDPPVIPEGAGYATALQLSSDHLPVRLDLQVPSEISVNSSLAFGNVIVGAGLQSRNLIIHNPAVPPADSLNCTLTPPAGFGSPAVLAVAAADSGTAVITMNTTSAGQQAGNLTIASDAPDDQTQLVGLAGTVLNHAAASLDSTTVLHTATVDFGDHPVGNFSVQNARVFNYGYNALQARLLVSNAVITGGAGRFYFLNGFTPQLIAGTGQNFALAFNDNGAASDSTYTATLTFTSADEPLPGALSQPDLVITLRAHILGVAGGNGSALPTSTRLHEPSPNPTEGGATMQLDLARPMQASVAVYDLAGRRVAWLRHGTYARGRYLISWSGQRDNGTSAGSGTFFVRLSAPGLRTQTVRLTILR